MEPDERVGAPALSPLRRRVAIGVLSGSLIVAIVLLTGSSDNVPARFALAEQVFCRPCQALRGRSGRGFIRTGKAVRGWDWSV